MVPFSAIKILENSPTQLVVNDPPYYIAGAAFLVASLAVSCLGFLRSGNEPGSRIGWPSLVMAAPFLIIAIVLGTYQTTLTFSRASGNLTVTRTSVFLWKRSEQIPLSSVERSYVSANDNSRRLNIVLSSGRIIGVGTHTDRQGYFDADAAINAFLGRSPQP